jgi:hypothetical protein
MKIIMEIKVNREVEYNQLNLKIIQSASQLILIVFPVILARPIIITQSSLRDKKSSSKDLIYH